MGRRSLRGHSEVWVSGFKGLPALPASCRCYSGWFLVRAMLGRAGNLSVWRFFRNGGADGWEEDLCLQLCPSAVHAPHRITERLRLEGT